MKEREGENARRPEIDPVDAGLSAAFGPSTLGGDPRHSVLAAVSRIAGESAKMLLREEESQQAPSPILKRSSEGTWIARSRGQYQMLGEIARGGMGAVLKAHDIDLGRDVAIKVMHGELAKHPEVLQRFIEEAQIGGQLQHPGIVPVYELGLMADERPYFAMKLVKGRTLAALLSERKSPADDRRRLLDIFEAVCQTMAYAHSRGVIHRDLKPSNVMVGAFGEVQVVDWGLSKVLRSGGTADEKRAKDRHTQISIIETVRSNASSVRSDSMVGSILGTAAYMSPEQARGDVGKLDERSDVFSLGALLCEILTGLPPYSGPLENTVSDAAMGRTDAAIERLDACGADKELIELTKECLMPAQAARPRNAALVAERMKRHLESVEDRETSARIEAAEANVKAGEERKARKLTLSLAASMFVTLVLAGGGWLWTSSEKSRRERETETQVNAALNDATLKRGESKWAEALAAVERAKGLADSGAASDELRTRVASDFATMESDAKLARAKAHLARDNAALLAELADIRQPEGDTFYPTDWAKLDADHSAIFARHGFDLNQQTEIAAADALSIRGIPVELAAALDEWAAVRSSAGDKTGATRLLNLSRRIDADVTRSQLRDALLASDVTALKTFAANEDLATLPATTLQLLGTALRKNGAMNEAISVFRQAQQLHPGDFMLTMSLARTLLYAAPPLPEEASRFYTAALALRPSSAEVAHELGKTLDDSLEDHAQAMELFRNAVAVHPEDGHQRAHLASSFLELGNRDAAVSTAREAIALAPKDAWAHVTLGSALEAKDDPDGAIAAYRKAIELDPKYAAAYTALGAALQKKDDLDGAIAAHRKAIELDPKDAEAQNNLGAALQKKNDLDGAIAAHRKAIELDPKLAAAYTNLGCALQDKGDHDGAIAAHRKAIELDPKYAGAQNNLGVALQKKNDLEGAIAAYRKATELDPKYVLAHTNLGNVLRQKGDVDGAIECDQKAIELDPKNALAHSNLGVALLAKGDVDGAIAAHRKAIELDPKYAAAYKTLGDALRDTGDVDGALAEYRKAIELDPKYAEAQNNLGVALQKKKDPEGAIAAYRKATELDPKFVLAHTNLGDALCTKGDVDGAIECHRKAIELDPKNARAHSNLGSALLAKGDVDGAIAECRRTIELDSKNVAAYKTLGDALREKDDLDGAIAAYREAIKLDPKNAAAYTNLGNALHKKGDVDGAVAAHRKAIELDPNLAGAYTNLGCALHDKGDLDEAIGAHRKAIELDPKLTGAYTNLGNALRDKGDLDEAIGAHRKAIELDPKLAGAYANLGNALRQKGDVDGAIAAYRKAIELDPKRPGPLVALAMLLTTRADVGRRDYAEALRLAQRVVEIAPEDPNSFSTLGSLLFDGREWRNAIEPLNRFIQLNRGEGELDQYRNAVIRCCLAVAHARLGELDKARADFGLAKTWYDAHPKHENSAELARCLDEARAAIKRERSDE